MKQEQALAILKSGKNVFLTGSAGAGKTYVLNQYISYLKERKVAVAVTASTGIAATHMNGMTIHSWAGIGVKNSLSSANLKTLKTKKYLEKKLDKVKVLIIDEISMLHQNQLQMVEQVLQYFKMNSLPFGGIQIVLCGDFFQLPPIGNESSREKFAFMSPAWVNAELSICYLSEQFRQNDDSLQHILNEIRGGKLSEYRFQQLQTSMENKEVEKMEPTRLYTHNLDVDQINSIELKKLGGKSKFFGAETKGNEKLIETLKKSVLAMEQIELKIGAKVMFVRNNPEKGIVNGSLGEVIDFDGEEFYPLVKLLDGRMVQAEPEDWKIQDEGGKTLANFIQIPLRLAWAITVHKSQGMTLDAAEIDLSKTFEKGQGYVALSRLKSIKSLHLKGLNNTALQIDGLAFKADQRFQQLSGQALEQLNFEELEKEAKSFIKKCGGTLDPKEIKKQQGKIKQKLSKDTTYDLTFSYLQKDMPIEQIAIERGMAAGTIAGHLIRIKKERPEHNFSFYKPKKAIVTKVEKAYLKQNNKEGISLKAIYDNLDGKVSYQDIKLAIAFIV